MLQGRVEREKKKGILSSACCALLESLLGGLVQVELQVFTKLVFSQIGLHTRAAATVMFAN